MKNRLYIELNKINLLIIITNISFTFYSQDSIKPKWFNFSIQSALVVNNSFSNYYESESYTLGGYHYVQNVSAKTNKPICYGYSGGLDFQIGTNQKFKQIIGLYFDFTNSYFNLKNSSGKSVGYLKINRSYSNIDIKRQVSIIGFNYGVQFNIKKHFNISVLGCFNYLLKRLEIQTGYNVKIDYNYIKDSTLINTKQSYINKDTAFASIKVRLDYNFNVKKQNLAVFVQRNISLPLYHNNTYYAPWWMIGIHYYPLRNRKQ